MNEDGPNLARLDPAVRQALAIATDKEHIVSAFYLGYAEAWRTMITPIDEEWHYEPTASESYSVRPRRGRESSSRRRATGTPMRAPPSGWRLNDSLAV